MPSQGARFIGARVVAVQRRASHQNLGLFDWVPSPQIGPADARQLLGLGAAPGGDFGVIARQENVGDRQRLPIARARVVRILEQACLEAFLG